ncbi:MAG: hypothetical protein JRJ84_22870, partial [Deltaproteobacteria bacterium]|nr:hypothetical protein [Deltaproteobacteria bacterium]
MDSDDKDKIKSAFDDLTAASHKLAEVMYQTTSAPGGETPPGGDGDGGGTDADDVIDAEYEDA